LQISWKLPLWLREPKGKDLAEQVNDSDYPAELISNSFNEENEPYTEETQLLTSTSVSRSEIRSHWSKSMIHGSFIISCFTKKLGTNIVLTKLAGHHRQGQKRESNG